MPVGEGGYLFGADPSTCLHESALTKALIEAAKAGKEVTVVVELRARFDEEANIAVTTQLQDVGVHVVYGVVGYKTHAKMLMIVRREERVLRRYVHLGTGNYHAGNSHVYSDFGLLSCDKEIYCGSAGWMERNLFSRVEVCFPVLDPLLREKVLKEGLLP